MKQGQGACTNTIHAPFLTSMHSHPEECPSYTHITNNYNNSKRKNKCTIMNLSGNATFTSMNELFSQLFQYLRGGTRDVKHISKVS